MLALTWEWYCKWQYNSIGCLWSVSDSRLMAERVESRASKLAPSPLGRFTNPSLTQSVYILCVYIYWVTKKLPQICTVILCICIGKVAWFAVYICGNFWVTQYVSWLRFTHSTSAWWIKFLIRKLGHDRLFISRGKYLTKLWMAKLGAENNPQTLVDYLGRRRKVLK